MFHCHKRCQKFTSSKQTIKKVYEVWFNINDNTNLNKIDLSKQSQNGWRKQAFWIKTKKEVILINNMSPPTSLWGVNSCPFPLSQKYSWKAVPLTKSHRLLFHTVLFFFLRCLALKPIVSILNFLHRGEFKETNGFSQHERNSLCNKLDLHRHCSMLHCHYESII